MNNRTKSKYTTLYIVMIIISICFMLFRDPLSIVALIASIATITISGLGLWKLYRRR